MMKQILGVTYAACAIVVPVAAQQINNLSQPNGRSASTQVSASAPNSGPAEIWQSSNVGEGFSSHAQEVSFSTGTGFATYDIGGKIPHDLWISRLSYGHMLGGPVGVDHWYRGNWEFLQEVFGAWQYSPKDKYLIGTTSLVRYNFSTGTRFTPFLDAGAGGSLTDIGRPDLGTTGEFNLQIGPGLHYFFNDHTALTVQYRYLHISDAGLGSPNQGVNENIAYIGVSWFF